MSSSPIVTVPEVGGSTPAITLNKVVFPAPLGPITPVIDPSSISIEDPSTARKPPKCRCRFLTLIIPNPCKSYTKTAPLKSGAVSIFL